jgi:hypothetical protein
MIPLSENANKELSQRNKYCIPVVEFYARTTYDITSVAAPANAFGRFAGSCFTWKTSAGNFEYQAKIKSFPSVQTFITDQVNTAEITFSNVSRGETSMSRFVLDNQIKGSWMVIRLIFPNYPDESRVLFWGKADRPGAITNEELAVTASQDLGNYKQEIPFRNYQVTCPLDFARRGGDCMGDETLDQKAPSYQLAVAKFGTAGCNKLFSTCTLLGNTNFFQGQQVVAVSGQFSYITVEEVIKRVLFWTKRKKIQVVKTDNWSSVNQSEGNEVVPLAFGRCQIQGHPFTWADLGEQVKSLQGFCEGKISAFTFVRSRTQGIDVVSVAQHLGEYGNRGTQTPDTLFNGVSGFNSRLAYLEVTTNGSSPTQVDNAPIITAVIRGLEIPVPDADGNFTMSAWTNNPSYITRYVLTDLKYARIPPQRIDDFECVITGFDCDSLIEDRTNCENIVLPANEFDNYGVGYRRFRSTGQYTAYKDMYLRGVTPENPPVFEDPSLSSVDTPDFPEFEDTQVRWFDPFQPYVIPPQNSVLRQKYTANGALQEKTSILDFINDRLLPVFKGYINYAPNGKIQIKNRRKADNGYLRAHTESGTLEIPVTSVKPWRDNPHEYLLVGVSLQTAEIRTVKTVNYSTACNNLSITADASGGLTVSAGNITGGSSLAPGRGYVFVDGTPAANDEVIVHIDSGDNAFDISYIADGVEDLETFVRMLCAYLNANVQFNSYLTATIYPHEPGRIWIQCESGYLVLNKALEYDHDIGEEVLRVQAVFENCSELTANTSAQFDNILEGTFKWNDNEKEEVNALTAKYTSAVDDFHYAILMPRAAWDTIDLEGELTKEELDLTFVDNYWQAAYLTKGTAIERIDGNLHFTFDTDFTAIRLELGDVVAVRHDSGDGALNYTPVFITTLSTDLDAYKVSIGAQLYLSAAFDLHVQPIDPLLTTTLNPTDTTTAPPTTGTNGGISVSTEPNVVRPDHKYYEQFSGLGKYSPTGVDLV